MNETVSVSYNSTGCHISHAGRNGFRVVSSFERRVTIDRPNVGGLLLFVSQKATSNLFALATDDTCLIFDDSRRRTIGKLGPFDSKVVGVRWADDAVAVQLVDRVLVYDVVDLRLVLSETCPSDEGASAARLTAASANGVTRVSFPGQARGTVVVVENPCGTSEQASATPMHSRTVIKAHKHQIAGVCLSPDGLKLATASEKGTVLRIHDVTTIGSCPSVFELRRSSTKARIHAMAFSFDSPSTLFACVSDTGTLHVFELTKSSPASVPTFLQRSTWRYELPGKDPCAISFHARSARPLLTAASHAGTWQVALLLRDDGGMTCLERFPEDASRVS